MATATALARARPAKTTCNPTPTSQIIGPEGPKHPGNRQLYDKRGCPDAGAPLCGNHADTKVATFCAALWLTFTLPLTGIDETAFSLSLGRTKGRNVNHAGGPNYAPSLFAEHPEREGMTKRALKAAMDTLLIAGKIRIVESGPPSKRRSHLEVAE